MEDTDHHGHGGSSHDDSSSRSSSDEAVPGHSLHQHMTTEAGIDITLGEHGARAVLRHLPNVKKLYIRYTPMNDDEDEHPLGNEGYSVTVESIVGMFHILAQHPCLRRLIIDNLEDMEADEMCHCHFPIKALTGFLEKARQISSIELDLDTAISGTEEDGRAFLRVLKDHASLKNLEIINFGNQNSSINASRFSPLCTSKWETLVIAHTQNQITDEQIDQNLKSPTLKRLWINTHHGPFRRHFPTIFERLRRNACHVSEFNMLVDLNEESAALLVAMLRDNTTLQNLFVCLGVQSKYGALITDSLLNNTHVQFLRLVMAGERNGDAKEMIGHLRRNRHLTKIHIHLQGVFDYDRVKEVFMEPFAKMLENNCYLEELCMDTCHCKFELTPEIKFFLSLNKAGRKHLMNTDGGGEQTATRPLWLDTIIQNRSDINIVFYFITQSPSFLPPTRNA